MRMIPLGLVTVAIFGVLLAGALEQKANKTDSLAALKSRYSNKHVKSVDHSKLPALQRKFSSPQEVTEACLSCHTERGKEVMATSHWNWERLEYIPGRGVREVGKRNVINNFCIGVTSNLEGCDKCHAGYGFVDNSFDFHNEKNIDCLICHDNSDTYTKGLAGMPAPNVNLTLVAQKVGRPLKSDCGTCHFYGGGGNGVKHGDLDQSILTADREEDVHMASGGGDLDCVACHTAENHQIRGRMYSVASMNTGRATCEQCHGEAPHTDGVLNNHTARVACQTCHIPEFGRGDATKMTWDWSTAGRLKNGEPYEEKDAQGNPRYASIKGTFKWEKNVKPEYVWFNGTADHYLLGDKAPAQRPIPMNRLFGSADDPESKIIPIKVHRAKQIYDPVNNMVIQPKLYAREKGEGGFWKDFDWGKAAAAGMKEAGLPYSGRYEFVDTVMYWPLNHQVAPKEKSVACVECHTPQNSRLAAVTGFYMPGRDRSGVVDLLGLLAIAGTFGAALLHGAGRALARVRRS